MSAASLPLAGAGAAGAVTTAPGTGTGTPPAAGNAVGAATAAAVDTAAPATVTEAGAARSPAPPVAGVAQPSAPGPAPPSPATAGSLGGAVFALVLVVGLILALAWLARRMPGLGGSAGHHQALRLVGTLALGPRERLVVVEVGATQLLLGVGAAGTRTLHTLEQPLPEPVPRATPAFAQLLARHLGRTP